MKTISALAPWFGSNRTLAENVGKALEGCQWVGIPFAGGMCELRHITARTIVVSDLHSQVINLANILRHPALGMMLIRDLRRLPFHEYMLRHAQEHCIRVETAGLVEDPETAPLVNAYADALNYFVCCWMSRNATAGTKNEFTASFSIRWDAGGGDSALRFRNATEGLREWRRIVERCSFVVMDVFDFLPKVKDLPKHGVYVDPPFPDAGNGYKFTFTEEQHRELATRLVCYGNTRVVCRFYDHPLIRSLYPETYWTWHRFEGRKQTNDTGPEVLLTRGPA
jgi:DNA adenine methylase